MEALTLAAWRLGQRGGASSCCSPRRLAWFIASSCATSSRIEEVAESHSAKAYVLAIYVLAIILQWGSQTMLRPMSWQSFLAIILERERQIILRPMAWQAFLAIIL